MTLSFQRRILIPQDEYQHPLDTKRCWWICLFASTSLMIATGTISSYGVFFNKFAMEFKANASEIATVGSLTYGFSLASSASSGYLRHRGFSRIGMMAGTLLCTCALLISSISTQFHALFASYSVGFGIGHGLLVYPLLLVGAEYFNEYEGTVSFILIASCFLGILIFVPIANILVEVIRWRNVFRFQAGLLSLTILPSFLIRRSPLTRPLEARLYHGRPLVVELKLWRNRPLYMWMLVVSLAMTPACLPYIHLIPYSVTVGIPQIQSTVLMFTHGIGLLLGAVAFVQAYKRGVLSYVGMCQFSMVANGLCYTLLPYCTKLWSLVLYTIASGMVDGALLLQIPLFAFTFAGTSKMLCPMVTLSLCCAVTATAGSSIAGRILQDHGSYCVTFTSAGVILFLSSLLLHFLPYVARGGNSINHLACEGGSMSGRQWPGRLQPFPTTTRALHYPAFLAHPARNRSPQAGRGWGQYAPLMEQSRSLSLPWCHRARHNGSPDPSPPVKRVSLTSRQDLFTRCRSERTVTIVRSLLSTLTFLRDLNNVHQADASPRQDGPSDAHIIIHRVDVAMDPGQNKYDFAPEEPLPTTSKGDQLPKFSMSEGGVGDGFDREPLTRSDVKEKDVGDPTRTFNSEFLVNVEKIAREDVETCKEGRDNKEERGDGLAEELRTQVDVDISGGKEKGEVAADVKTESETSPETLKDISLIQSDKNTVDVKFAPANAAEETEISKEDVETTQPPLDGTKENIASDLNSTVIVPTDCGDAKDSAKTDSVIVSNVMSSHVQTNISDAELVSLIQRQDPIAIKADPSMEILVCHDDPYDLSKPNVADTSSIGDISDVSIRLMVDSPCGRLGSSSATALLTREDFSATYDDDDLERGMANQGREGYSHDASQEGTHGLCHQWRSEWNARKGLGPEIQGKFRDCLRSAVREIHKLLSSPKLQEAVAAAATSATGGRCCTCSRGSMGQNARSRCTAGCHLHDLNSAAVSGSSSREFGLDLCAGCHFGHVDREFLGLGAPRPLFTPQGSLPSSDEELSPLQRGRSRRRVQFDWMPSPGHASPRLLHKHFQTEQRRPKTPDTFQEMNKAEEPKVVFAGRPKIGFPPEESFASRDNQSNNELFRTQPMELQPEEPQGLFNQQPETPQDFSYQPDCVEKLHGSISGSVSGFPVTDPCAADSREDTTETNEDSQQILPQGGFTQSAQACAEHEVTESDTTTLMADFPPIFLHLSDTENLVTRVSSRSKDGSNLCQTDSVSQVGNVETPTEDPSQCKENQEFAEDEPC